MFIRFALAVLTACLLFFAVRRLLNGNRAELSPTQNSHHTIVPTDREKISWRKKSIVVARREEFQELQKQLRSGDFWLLKQKTMRGDQCTYGMFRAERADHQNVFFTALERRKQSRMKTWAEAQNIAVDWEWQPLRGAQTDTQQSQLCSQWMHVGRNDEQIRQVLRSRRYFLRSVHYSDVKAVNPAELEINVDHFRRGWWITPKTGISRSHVILRDGRSGVSKKVLMEFQGSRSTQQKQQKKMSDGVTFKSFTLPGWD